MTNMENFSLKWSAPEYHHYERTTDWFWAVGIITISIAVLAFFFHNVLFGVLVLLSAAILISFVFQAPKEIEYEINNRGVTIGKDLHPYLTLEAFWMETRGGGEPKLILRAKKNFMPYMIIPVHDESADEIANTLRNFIEEKEMHEPTAHKVMEYLGF